MTRPDPQTRPDLYARVTDVIITDLERGVRTWAKPWSAEHLAGRVTRPLRHNLQPYNGINVILLWSEAVTRGFTAPIWMTFRQAVELGGHVRKGERGATVVYANRISRTETDDRGQDGGGQQNGVPAPQVRPHRPKSGQNAHGWIVGDP